jgi:hypothetical protein
MTMTKTTTNADVLNACKAWNAADDAWSALLHSTFGIDAATARYAPEGEGRPGTALNDAYRAYVAAGEFYRTLVAMPMKG